MYVPIEALPGYTESTAVLPRNDTLMDTSGPLYDWLTGGDGDWGVGTSSGARINESTAMRIAAVWACVRNISEDIGKMPLNVYRSMKPRGREIVSNHPVQRLIHTAPNDHCDAMTFRQTLQAQALTWGNGYAEIVRDNAGEPLALYMIPACMVQVKVQDDGSVYYQVWTESGPEFLESSQMFHLRGLGGTPYVGWSPIRTLRETLGIATAAEQSEGSLFGKGAIPAGIIEVPNAMKQEARTAFQKSWENAYGGANNRGKTAVMEAGMKYHAITMPFKDAQFVELRQFSIDEIARIFRVPPHKIMDLTHGTFSNIEHQNTEYVTDCLTSWAVRWEQEINRKLIPVRQQGSLFAKHVFQSLVRGDMAVRQSFYTAMFNIGVMSPNDIRELEELNPVDGGDTNFVQANITPLDIAAEGPPEPPPAPNPPPNEPKPDEHSQNQARKVIAAHADVFSEAVGRMLRIEADRVRRQAGKPTAADAIDKFYRTHAEAVLEAFAIPLTAFASVYALANGGSLGHFAIHDAILAIRERHLAQSRAEMADPDSLETWTNGERADVFAVRELCRLAALIDQQKGD